MKLPSPSSLAPSARVIALDVGGTSVKSALVAPGGVSSESRPSHPLTVPVGPIAFWEPSPRSSAPPVGGANLEPRRRGFGFPGPFDYEAGICLIEGVEKYGALYGVNMREALRARLDLGDLPILFRNDAEAAVVGKRATGRAGLSSG